MVRALVNGAMGRRTDPTCGEPIELFLVPASAPRLFVTKATVCAILWDGAYKRTLAVWWQRVSFLTIRMVLNHMSDAI